LDAELFFKAEIGTLEGILELTPEGKKMRIMKKLKELRDKYEKDGKVEYLDLGLLQDSPESALKEANTDFNFKRSTTNGNAFRLDLASTDSLSLTKTKSSKDKM
jgi:hypothetical protein